MNYSQKLYDALRALSDYQHSHSDNMVIHGNDVLGEKKTRLLLDGGYLSQVMKGWYIPSKPESIGDTTIWYASYWKFVSKYLRNRFGDQWTLSPELSLYLHGGNTVIPKQLVVRSPKAGNNIQSLPFSNSIIDIKSSIPKDIVVNNETGMNVYSVEEALLNVAPDYYLRNKTEALVCLSLIQDESNIIRIAADNGMLAKCGRLSGALKVVGKELIADRIITNMKRFGYYDIRDTNPFEENIITIKQEESPYVTRIGIMWDKMRLNLIEENVFRDIHPTINNGPDVLKMMDDYYLLDSYHSLSIEGYVVSQGLLERVRSGSWSPQTSEKDEKERNALAARGYYQAYGAVRESVGRILSGDAPAKVFVNDYRDWHFQLFEPCVRAGLLKASDLAGFRNHPVYIRGSLHTPVGPHAVPGCMKKLEELMTMEQDPLIRATLGHFFFTYIHPYMDGNGRTARFLMNTQLCSAGYEWIVIPKELRNDYMLALEKAGVEEDIIGFGSLVAKLLRNPIRPQISPQEQISKEDMALLESIGVDTECIKDMSDNEEVVVKGHFWRPKQPWDTENPPVKKSSLSLKLVNGNIMIKDKTTNSYVPLSNIAHDSNLDKYAASSTRRVSSVKLKNISPKKSH